MGFELATDYNDVASRIVEFREKYPDGRLRQHSLQFLTFAGKDWVVYTAEALRSPDDPNPGQGTAWEPVPGRTPYTRDSELQNAETAAWGRAILATLAADAKKGVASAEEVRNRTVDRDAEQAPADPLAGKRQQVLDHAKQSYDSPQAFALDFAFYAGEGATVATADEAQLDKYLAGVGVPA